MSLPALSEELSPAAGRQIEEAERELLLAEASHRRAVQRLEALQSDPSASDEALLAMESYVFELSELVSVRRQTLNDLRSLAGQSMPSPDPAITQGMEAFESAVEDVPSAEPEETEQERLDREFAASLEEFDGMILAYNREVEDSIAARTAEGEAEASPHQAAAAEAEELLRSMGVDPGTGSGEEGGQETVKVAGAASEPVEPGPSTEGSQERPRTAGTQGTAGGGSSRPPRDDEDVVARQLREAAEQETDPVLREKLWKEYEAYLDGRS